MFVVFENPDGTQGTGTNVRLDSDQTILWQGASFQAFLDETGFSASQIGGLVLDNGTLTYDANKQEQLRQSQLSAREVGNQLIDDLTLEWQDLTDTYPLAAPELLSIGTSVRQAIDNAVRVAELRQQPLNLTFAKSLIQNAAVNSGMTLEESEQARLELLALFPTENHT